MHVNNAPTIHSSTQRVPTRQALLFLFDALIEHGAAQLDCDECRQRLAEYVETKQPGQHAWLASVHSHLAMCSSCAQMYLDHIELEAMEASGNLPMLPHPIQFDLSMLRTGGHTPLGENQGA